MSLRDQSKISKKPVENQAKTGEKSAKRNQSI